MGNISSNQMVLRGENLNRSEREVACFVVPGYLQFTPRQLEIMANAGQQPGVPFRIGGSGAIRPQGIKKCVSRADSSVHIKRNSIGLVEENRRTYSLKFVYDAAIPCKLTIYIGAKDKTNAQRIRIGSALQMWGPFTLPPATNKEWSSRTEKCFAEESCLPGFFSRPVQDCFDVVVILDPQESLLQLREVRRKERLRAVMVTDEEKDREKLRPMNIFTPNFLLPNDYSSVKTVGSNAYPDLPPLPKQPQLQHNEILMHASFARIVGQGGTGPGTGKESSQQRLTIQAQKVLLPSGVFVILDIFGMDRGGAGRSGVSDKSLGSPLQQTTITTSQMPSSPRGRSSSGDSPGDTTPSRSPSPGRRNNGKVSPAPTPRPSLTPTGEGKEGEGLGEEGEGEGLEEGGGIGDVNADTDECVICLTNPREVAVFPCRHMCLCSVCAEALPSQGNKCPICRREANLLLRLGSSGSGDNEDATNTNSALTRTTNAVDGSSTHTLLPTIPISRLPLHSLPTFTGPSSIFSQFNRNRMAVNTRDSE